MNISFILYGKSLGLNPIDLRNWLIAEFMNRIRIHIFFFRDALGLYSNRKEMIGLFFIKAFLGLTKAQNEKIR